jgi:hypothetical protein
MTILNFFKIHQNLHRSALNHLHEEIGSKLPPSPSPLSLLSAKLFQIEAKTFLFLNAMFNDAV